MFIKGNELDFKASYYSIADRWHIDEGCKDSISVNIEHTGDVINVTPCEYDGSAYIIADDIGIVKGEIALIRMIFIKYDKIMYIIDRGKLAFRDKVSNKAYVIDNTGKVKEISEEEQEKKVYWYKYDKSVYECAHTYIKNQCKMEEKVVEKYLFNFIITFSLKYEDNCATTRYYKIDDSIVSGYGLYYLKKSDLIIDNSKEEEEADNYISGDSEEPEDEQETETDYSDELDDLEDEEDEFISGDDEESDDEESDDEEDYDLNIEDDSEEE